MKILFASDMSLNYMNEAPTLCEARTLFTEAAAEFHRADFSMVNLETVFGERGNYTPLIKSGPSLLCSYDFFNCFDALAPSLLGMANNHARDFGDEALADTIRFLDGKGYSHVGAEMNLDEAYAPHIFEKDGVRVAIYAIAENEPGYAEDDHGGMAGYSLTRVTRALRESRERGELPVIYFHGGNEYNPFPSPGKTELYRHFVDLGAAAVIAMHTHCPQGNEYYNGAPIIYSMGNFFFPWRERKNESWYYGYMTLLDIKDGKVDYDIIPYTFSDDSHRLLKGNELEKFMRYMNYISAPLSDARKIREYFGAWCVKMGVRGLLPSLKFDEEMLAGDPRVIARFKNLLGCEAHNELMTASAKIIYDGKIEEYEKLIPEIERLQNMELI